MIHGAGPRRLFLREKAREDIASAFRWYEDLASGLGYEFIRALRVTLAAVENAPEQYPLALQDSDIRKAPMRRFPYVIYYVVLDSGISVIAVMHGRRHPRSWQSRR